MILAGHDIRGHRTPELLPVAVSDLKLNFVDAIVCMYIFKSAGARRDSLCLADGFLDIGRGYGAATAALYDGIVRNLCLIGAAGLWLDGGVSWYRVRERRPQRQTGTAVYSQGTAISTRTANHEILTFNYEARNHRTIETVRDSNTKRVATAIGNSGDYLVGLRSTALEHESVSACQGHSFVPGGPWLSLELW